MDKSKLFANYEFPKKVPTPSIEYSLENVLGTRTDYVFESNRYDSNRPGFYLEETARGTEMIDMDDSGEIVVQAGEEKRIATFGLGGCVAVGLAAELPDGSRKAYVQHYSPLNDGLSAALLAQATQQTFTEGGTNFQAVIMTPGTYSDGAVGSPINGMIPADEQGTFLLKTALQEGFGADTAVEVYPYSCNIDEGKYGQGTLLIELKADGSTQFQTEAYYVNFPER